MHSTILKYTAYAFVTVGILGVSVGLMFFGFDLRREDRIIAEAARTSPEDAARIVHDITEFRNRPSVLIAELFSLRNTITLDALLCEALSRTGEPEAALTACSRAIVAGSSRGFDVDNVIYNRGMVAVGATYSVRGALSIAEVNLRRVTDFGYSRAYLEQIYLIEKAREELDKSSSSDRRDTKDGYKDPFTNNQGGADNFGF